MSRHRINRWKKILCYVCAALLCLPTAVSASAEEGKIWTHSSFNGVSFREAADNGWYVCDYDPAKNQAKTLSLASSYQVSPIVGDSGAAIFSVRGIDDGVFGRQEDGKNHIFSLMHIEASEGMTIGQSAFQGVVVQGDSSAAYTAEITGDNLAQIGKYAFEEAGIRGDLLIARVKGFIGTGAFSNATIDGDFTIQQMKECVIEQGAFEKMEVGGKFSLGGSIDTLGDYAFSGLSADSFSMTDNVIRHMGDKVFYNMNLRGATYPLSNALETMGSKVFEGTGVAAVQLPNSDTMKEAAADAFPDTEGMTIIIPEKLTNLEVYHFERYHHLTFQTAEGLPDDSPVIRYLTENGLPYKKGPDGELIEPSVTPEPSATSEPKPTVSPTAPPESKPTASPPETPEPEPTAPLESKPTASPIETPEPELTASPEPELTALPEPELTASPTETLEPELTASPTETPEPEPTASPIETSEPKPTVSPVGTRQPKPTLEPTTTPDQRPGGTMKPEQTTMPEQTPEQPAQPIPTASSSAGTSVIVNVNQTVEPTMVQGNGSDQPPQNTEDTQNKPSSSDKTTVYRVGKLKYEITGKNKVIVAGVTSSGAANIVIPDNIEIQGRLYQVIQVKKRAFYGQKRLKKVKMGNYVREIGAEAFAMCPGLVRIQFGTGLVKIGKRALYQDKGLRQIVFRGTKLKKIGKETFSGVSPKKVSIKVKKSKLAFYQRLIEKAR